MKGIKHFRTKREYKKWLAYGHLHGDFDKTQGYQRIFIGGKAHKVSHKRRRK